MRAAARDDEALGVMMRNQWILGLLFAMGMLAAWEGHALAQAAPVVPPGEAAADASTMRGRAAYARGVQRSKDAQWGEALAAFEEAAAARDAPIVQYNIGFCQRALGTYVAARRTFRRVLANTEGLAASQIDDSKTFAAELDQLVVRVAIAIDPPGTPLAVDGRALRADKVAGEAVFVNLPGAVGAKGPEVSAFTVEIDPGVHLFRATRPGHQDAFVQKSYRAGEKATLDLHLDLLPARVAVSADPAQALVRVDSREAGLAPIDIERPPGIYKIEVVRDGFETYGATFDLHAGQRADLTAKLVPVRKSVLKQWWFWTAAAVVVAGGAVLTYELTRPAPPYDGGSLNWVAGAKPTAFRW
jgi:hypothetical protein